MPDFVDPYLDPKTGILRNRLGITDQEALSQAEADLATLGELSIDKAFPRTHDEAELKAIHKQLFQDLYDFAGQYRTVDIRKNREGSEFFLIVSKILTGLQFVFGELKQENYLKDLPKEGFVERLAYFYDQLNYIHPFREGNGRTQRIFWNHIADEAGYFIDWDKVVGDENNLASRVAAETMDRTLLVNMFSRIVAKK